MTKYIDGTQEPDEAFATVLAEFDAAPPTVEQMTGVLLTAILGDTDGGLVLEGDLPAAEIARLIAEVAAPAALAVFRDQQDPAVQRVLALADMVERDALESAEPDDPESAEHVRACALLVVSHSIRAAIGGDGR